jgi:hypothetical protein
MDATALDGDARVAAGHPRAVDADEGVGVAADQILAFRERDFAIVPGALYPPARKGRPRRILAIRSAVPSNPK